MDPSSPPLGEAPRFSVVVPTYRRPGPLTRCLAALASLEYPRDRFEVVVVDDGGGMPLAEVVAPFRDRIDLVLVEQPRQGPAAARNAGAARARGEWLAFTDDDCRPAPDWMDRLARRAASLRGDALGGCTVNALPDNVYATASQMLVSHLYAHYQGNSEGKRFFASNNLCVRADLFRAAGGFDGTFPRAAAEDRDFCDRWTQVGHGLTYAPEAVVHHAPELTFWRFCAQHFRYGRGAYRFQCRRARRGRGAVRIERASFYLGMMRFPFKEGFGARAAVLAVLLAVSQAANAAGFAAAMMQGEEP